MNRKDFFDIPTIGLLENVEDLENLKLPNPTVVQNWKEMKDRILVLDFDIGDILMDYIRYIIQWNKDDKGKKKEDRQTIFIYIYSYGGDADIMMAFIDTLKLSKTPIKLINLGQACSAASLIFMAKTENITRLILKNARVLIHQGQAGLQGQTNAVLDMAENMRKNEEKIKSYVLENTTITSKLYAKKKREEWVLDAETALKLGVCDKIITDIDELY